jgi:hypothetical protein
MNQNVISLSGPAITLLDPAPPHTGDAGGKVILCSGCSGEHFELVGAGGVSYAGYGINCSGCTHIQYFGKNSP